MTSRKPLSAKNSDYGPGNEAMKSKPKKKSKSYFRVLDRPTLVTQLNVILKDTLPEGSLAPFKLVEEDLVRPTPERVQLVYFKLLNCSFDSSIQSLTQAPFDPSGGPVHPELMEDFVYKIQFFRAMKFLMKTCLTNFQMADLTAPDPKRFCRHLSAFINYTKFHYTVYEPDEVMSRQKERKRELEETCNGLIEQQRKLQQQVAELERQRREEHELEEEHKARISVQTQQMQGLQHQKEMLTQQYHSYCEVKERSEQKLTHMVRELEKVSLRVDDLKKKVVTSPDKLKANLSRLQQQVREVIATTKEVEAQQKMWETLTSQAQQVPEGVTKALSENLEIVTQKAIKRNDLSLQYESIVEETSQQEQLLQEATIKLQSLHTHLKMVEEDSGRVALQEANKMSHACAIQELHRDIQLLQQEVRMKEMEDEKCVRNMKEEEGKMAEYRQVMQQASAEMEGIVRSLHTAFHDKANEYRDILKSLGVDLSQ